MNKHDNIRKWTIGIIFVVYIFGVLSMNIANPVRDFSESENRKLEQKPKFFINSLLKGTFTKNYEKYISDQFFLRDFWIGVKSNIEKIMGKKENNDVYLGEKGQLFQKFNKPKEKDVQGVIESVNNFCSLNPNVNKYLMVVPNATKVLENKLPKFAINEDELKYINKLKEATQNNIKFVDVYNELKSKNDEYIFYKTDHHWTSNGAYYAYEKLSRDMGLQPHSKEYFKIKNVTNDFYGSLYSKSGFRNIKPDSIELYIPKINEGVKVWYYDEAKNQNENIDKDNSKVEDNKYPAIYKMDNINKKDKYTIFFNGNHPLMKIKSNVHNDKKLLVIKDSYANSLLPFLTGHYSEIDVVDLRYYSEDLSKLIKDKEIDDVLILYNIKSFLEDSSVQNIYQSE